MATDDDWVALHVFYAANANPLLTECVGPLAEQLGAEGLLERWFFIRYWLEGPHVRLRLLPTRPQDADQVEARARAAVEAFLRRRPALYEEDRDANADLYRNLFVVEYGEDAFVERYGPDGVMPFRANNSLDRLPYERELERYGGPEGIELSERHFQFSSEQVLHTLGATSVHLRPILLGQAAVQSMSLAFALLRTPSAVADFFTHYRAMWEAQYQESSTDHHADFERSFDRMRDRLVQRARHLERATAGDLTSATATEARWLAHGAELREDVLGLHAAGRLTFRDGATPDADAALRILLSSYVHMANNRLGVSILDEIYLSYVIVRALDCGARTEVA